MNPSIERLDQWAIMPPVVCLGLIQGWVTKTNAANSGLRPDRLQGIGLFPETMHSFYFFSHRRLRSVPSATSESGGLTAEHIQFNKSPKTRLRIRVVVADDHPVMRNGLSQIINQQEDMEVIGQAEDGEEAAKVTFQLKPDVVLMDVIMPVLDGIGATQKIKSERPETCIIGLTMYEDPAIDGEMKIAGATRCLRKSCPTEVLLTAIRNCLSAI